MSHIIHQRPTILIDMHVSEKATRLHSDRTYVFFVEKYATKPMVRREIEKRYKVKVDEVNMLREKPKPTRFGMNLGTRYRVGIKKAMVVLKKGHTIEIEK